VSHDGTGRHRQAEGVRLVICALRMSPGARHQAVPEHPPPWQPRTKKNASAQSESPCVVLPGRTAAPDTALWSPLSALSNEPRPVTIGLTLTSVTCDRRDTPRAPPARTWRIAPGVTMVSGFIFRVKCLGFRVLV
jgi:hypothetical protein